MRERVRLSDVIDVASGQVDPREAPYCNMLHVGGDNIESGSGRLFGMRPARELNLISGKYEFTHSDVLYSKIRPALNKVALPDFSGICSADMYPLRPREGRLDRRYFAHLLRHSDFLSYAEKHSSRTNIPKINREALLGYEVDLPPIVEQRRIADILDKADAIRRKRKETIALTEELLRSTFLDMFGDPVTNPKGWPMTTLGEEAVEMKYGTSEKCGPPSPSSLPVLRIPNIVDGVIDWSDLKFAALDDRERTSLTLRSSDILFVRSNGNPDYIGRCAVFDSDRTALFASYLIRVRLRNGGLHPSYVRAALSSASYRSRLSAEARTTAGNYNISTEGLRRLRLAVPPLPLQHRFVEVERVASRTQQRLMAQLADSDTLFRSLVQRVFLTT